VLLLNILLAKCTMTLIIESKDSHLISLVQQTSLPPFSGAIHSSLLVKQPLQTVEEVELLPIVEEALEVVAIESLSNYILYRFLIIFYENL